MKSLILIMFLALGAQASEVFYTLKADIKGYIGVGGEIEGKRNPVLRADYGDLVSVRIINANQMPHDLALKTLGIKSKVISGLGDETTVGFKAKSDDEYYCSLPGHAAMGMKGLFKLNSSTPPDAPSQREVSRSPLDLPNQIVRRSPSRVEIEITSQEIEAKLEGERTFEFWTFDNKVPGPMLRVRQGDEVVIHLKNSPESKMEHSIDFHAVTGPHGGANELKAAPGEEKTLVFKAKTPGLFVYHCASGYVARHIAKGMYGMILVEPAKGMEPVDREFYLMQGELYTKDVAGSQSLEDDIARLSDELPTYYAINGRPSAVSGKKALNVKVGERVRIYFGVGGPNKASSLHIIGEIFDKVYPHGSFNAPVSRDIQTFLVVPGGAAVVELVFDRPGQYVLVDHALSRLGKGATAVFNAN